MACLYISRIRTRWAEQSLRHAQDRVQPLQGSCFDTLSMNGLICPVSPTVYSNCIWDMT
ncbi:MAG: hypothetical protein L0Y68_06050 [Candidatus Dadabacteria bacterium]|nr:hypothetical protein [Candidatus Dadabacteria bacterium]